MSYEIIVQSYVYVYYCTIVLLTLYQLETELAINREHFVLNMLQELTATSHTLAHILAHAYNRHVNISKMLEWEIKPGMNGYCSKQVEVKVKRFLLHLGAIWRTEVACKQIEDCTFCASTSAKTLHDQFARMCGWSGKKCKFTILCKEWEFTILCTEQKLYLGIYQYLHTIQA